MNINKYFERLKVQNIPHPDLAGLKKLHRSHLLYIPFENLDIHFGKRIVLDYENIEWKILNNNRGGFCYELNGLFYKLLSQIGFNVKMVSAGVYNSEGIAGPDYDHMALIVKIKEKEFLVDVGFGDNFMEPIKFELDKVQKDEAGYFKITKAGGKYYLLNRSIDGVNYKKEYRLRVNEEKLLNFEKMCNYHQTSSQSHFTQKRVCSRAIKNGRITLSDLKLIKTENGIKAETILNDEKEFIDVLKNQFNVILN